MQNFAKTEVNRHFGKHPCTTPAQATTKKFFAHAKIHAHHTSFMYKHRLVIMQTARRKALHLQPYTSSATQNMHMLPLLYFCTAILWRMEQDAPQKCYFLWRTQLDAPQKVAFMWHIFSMRHRNGSLNYWCRGPPIFMWRMESDAPQKYRFLWRILFHASQKRRSRMQSSRWWWGP